MNKKLLKYLEANWDELKGKVKEQWGKLTDNDILQIKGSYEELVAKLKKAYGDKLEDAENEILEFLSANGYKDKKNSEESDTETSIKNVVSKYVDEYFSSLKEKSAYFEAKTVQSVKENPLKWLSVAALGGFIIAKFIL